MTAYAWKILIIIGSIVSAIGTAVGLYSDTIQLPFFQESPIKTKLPLIDSEGLNKILQNIDDCKVSGIALSVGDSFDSEKNEISLNIKAQGTFNKSKYFIDDLQQKDCITQGINYFVESVKSIENKELTYLMDASFIGYADGKPESYGGKFILNSDDVIIPNAVVNNGKKSFYFTKNRKVNNEELAILRAYTMKKLFITVCDSRNLVHKTRHISYEAQVSGNYNSINRLGRLTITLIPKTEL